MRIDLQNLTEEDKAALKEALPGLDLGIVVLDPAKPMDRQTAEKVQLSIKVNGEEKTISAWDASQGYTKGEGADAKLREASDAKKEIAQIRTIAAQAIARDEAWARINAASKAGKVADITDFELVAPQAGEDPKEMMQAYSEAIQGGGGGNQKPDHGQKKITLEDLSPELAALLPNPVEKGWMTEGVNKSGLNFLETLVAKTIDNDPKTVKLREEVANDGNKKAILDSYVKSAKGTLDARLKGRIRDLSGRGDLDDAMVEQEAAKLAAQTMAELDVETILAKAAPPNIILGSGEPGVGSLKIVSGKPVEKVAMDNPNYVDNMAKEVMQSLAGKVGAPG